MSSFLIPGQQLHAAAREARQRICGLPAGGRDAVGRVAAAVLEGGEIRPVYPSNKAGGLSRFASPETGGRDAVDRVALQYWKEVGAKET